MRTARGGQRAHAQSAHARRGRVPSARSRMRLAPPPRSRAFPAERGGSARVALLARVRRRAGGRCEGRGCLPRSPLAAVARSCAVGQHSDPLVVVEFGGWGGILAARMTLLELFQLEMNSFEQDPNKIINALIKSFAEKYTAQGLFPWLEGSRLCGPFHQQLLCPRTFHRTLVEQQFLQRTSPFSLKPFV